MKEQREIGGYFELELPNINNGFPKEGEILVNSGRYALEYILRSLGSRIKSVCLPRYNCEVIVQTIRKCGLPYRFYDIGIDMRPIETPLLGDGEYIVFNNYFGLQDEFIESLSQRYGSRMIVDNAQAWYARTLTQIPTFYSPRKFFGVPDGGVVCGIEDSNIVLSRDYSADRCSHLLKRLDDDASSGYFDFKNNSKILESEELKSMSELTRCMLSSIDFGYVLKKRRENYQQLSEMLDFSNQLELPDINSFQCPMVFPYLTADCNLRTKLISNKIYVATYWPNVIEECSKDSVEYKLAKMLLPLPIDQRYNSSDMDRIVRIIRG